MEHTNQPENPTSPTALVSRIHALREEEAGLEMELRNLALAFIAKALNAVRDPQYHQPEMKPEDFVPVVAKTALQDNRLGLYFARRDYGEHYYPDGSTIMKLGGVMKFVPKLDDNGAHLQSKFKGIRGRNITHPYEYLVIIELSAMDKGEPETLLDPSAAPSDAPPPTPAVETRAAATQVIAG